MVGMDSVAEVKVRPADSGVCVGVLRSVSGDIAVEVHELLQAGQYDLAVFRRGNPVQRFAEVFLGNGFFHLSFASADAALSAIFATCSPAMSICCACAAS